MSQYVAAPISRDSYDLAEGVVWDDLLHKLWWVDVLSGDLWCGDLDGRGLVNACGIHIDKTVGCVAPAAGGGLLVAGTRQLFVVASDGGVRPSTSLPLSKQRLNDGACDPAGRFVVGTASVATPHRGNQLFQIDSSGRCLRLRSNVGLCNGLAWSPDHSTLYFVDSTPGTIWRCDYDSGAGIATDWSALFHVDDGTPDGMTVDSEGHLWIAVWGTGQVRQYSLTGEVLAVVHVDAVNTSSVTFAGPALDSLVISTARHGLSRDALERQPDSGRIFQTSVDATGLPIHRWSGGNQGSNPRPMV